MYKTAILLVLVTLAMAQAGEDEAQGQQAEISMKRTACLVLSRYHSNTQKEAIEAVVTELNPDQQQKYINKMYAMAIEHCLPTITMDETQKFFVEDPEFTPQDMFYIFDNFDYTAVVNNLDTLSKNQEALIKFMKNFDEEMQVRREEREAQDSEASEEKFEMKFFGISASDVPSFAKTIYVLIFVGVVGTAIVYLMTKLDTSKKSKSPNKRRKSPKKE